MTIVGGGEEGDPKKIPVENPRYGTFHPPPPPSAPPLPPPLPYPHHLHQEPPPSYQAIPVGYPSHSYPVVVEEGIPVTEPRLPFCGIGIGWALFLSGFFLAAIPWYIGVFILLFVALNHREKPGLVACTVAAGVLLYVVNVLSV